MKKIIIGVIITILISLVGYRIIAYQRVNKVLSISEIQKEMGVPVEVIKVKRGDLTERLLLAGTIQGEKEVEVGSKVAERVAKIYVGSGDWVKAGQVVAELDRASMSAQIDQAEALYERAEKDYRRMELLFREGAVAQQVLDQARANYEVAKANLAAAKSSLYIKAPISGIVTTKFIEEGEVIGVGKSILRIAKIENVKAIVPVSQMDRGKVSLQQPVLVTADAFPGEEFKGVVEEISPEVDPRSRSFEIKVKVKNPQGLLRPGFLVKVEIITNLKRDIVVIPRDAVREREGRMLVFIVGQDGQAREQSIKLGIAQGDKVEVLEGLHEGERITLGNYELKNGVKVKVIREVD